MIFKRLRIAQTAFSKHSREHYKHLIPIIQHHSTSRSLPSTRKTDLVTFFTRFILFPQKKENSFVPNERRSKHRDITHTKKASELGDVSVPLCYASTIPTIICRTRARCNTSFRNLGRDSGFFCVWFLLWYYSVLLVLCRWGFIRKWLFWNGIMGF